jgi:hypothetical protein
MLNWIRQNKALTITLLIIGYLLWKNNNVIPTPLDITPSYQMGFKESVAPPLSFSRRSLPVAGGGNIAPSESTDRLVVQESSLSLVVKDVREVSEKIVDFAKQNDGFMVNQNFSSPEEAPFATITVRIPSIKLQQVLNYYRGLTVKVSSENLLGTDVTDEYVDIEARLGTLNKTKAKFEEIMAKATEIQDILNVQRELISLQDQIDSLKGRQDYLEKTAKLAKITIYLSTDEFSLPYAPAETFRPEVIFKKAVRALVLTLRGIAEKLIWIAVFSVIWVPALIIVYFINRWYQKRNTSNRQN